MGTSGSYSGSGGKVGTDLRNDLQDWLDELPGKNPDKEAPDSDESSSTNLRLDPQRLLPVISLIGPRSKGGGADGPGGGGGGGQGGGGGRAKGGPSRSVGQYASTAGRAAAAAYAFRAGDADALEALGLDFAELSALEDEFEVTRRIFDAACGPRGESTIEDTEQRLVAAKITDWVLHQQGDGYVPTPEEIVKHTIALIVADTILSENGEHINKSKNAELAESEISSAAEALADRAEFSAKGVTEKQFADAIAEGIEALRAILEDGT